MARLLDEGGTVVAVDVSEDGLAGQLLPRLRTQVPASG